MDIIRAQCGQTARIAYQTENNRTQVRFDLSDIMNEFPGGTAVLTIRRPGDTEAVPSLSAEMEGTELVWTVTAWECERQGFLYAQVVYSEGETVAKTKIYRFSVSESLITTDGEEPDGWEDWVGQLTEAAADTRAAVESYDEMTAAATGLPGGSSPTAEIDRTGENPVLRLGIPAGEDSVAVTVYPVEAFPCDCNRLAKATITYTVKFRATRGTTQIGATCLSGYSRTNPSHYYGMEWWMQKACTASQEGQIDIKVTEGTDPFTGHEPDSMICPVNFTLEDGSTLRQTVTLFCPRDGYTPERGVDYWTEADQTTMRQDIASDVAAARQAINDEKVLAVGAVETAGTTQVGLVTDEGTAQKAAVVAQGQATIASIPSDYTNLSNDVSDLKSAIDSMDGGTTGQVLRKKSNTDGDWEWAGVAQPTDAQVAEAVDDWLEDHPEATTTVQDASLTESKFTAQTILDYKNYVVTPQMYGAKADGTTDDTTAIQNALNAHKKVYFPQGNYKITQPLVISNGHTIEGDSKYRASIKAVGCDCIHMTNGDQGEKGRICNIQLVGNETAGSKGIKLGYLAPGWSFVDVWIASFDYGIYGFNVGNINNIYIDKCVITGKATNRVPSLTAGIYIPNAPSNQINAITIRDTEIDQFESGIVIGGTAISILQCTIQTIVNGIVVDPEIGKSLGGLVNTFGMTIDGCYMEQIDRSCVYIKTRYDVSTTSAGFICGLRITSNYFYKDNQGDNDYAVIKFDKDGTYSHSANGGDQSGLQFSNVFIGMNHMSKPAACKLFDMPGCLSRDSIVMDAKPGARTNNNIFSEDLIGTGANIFTSNILKYEKVNLFAYNIWHTSGVTVSEDSIVVPAGGSFKLFIPRSDFSSIETTLHAEEYPVKVYANLFNRSRFDGELYSQFWYANNVKWNTNYSLENCPEWVLSPLNRTSSAETSFFTLSTRNNIRDNTTWNHFTCFEFWVRNFAEIDITVSGFKFGYLG